MKTRVANAGDFAAVLPMIRRQRIEQERADPALYKLHPDAEKRFRQWIGHVAEDPRATLLVAEEAGQMVGFLSATVERDPPIYCCEEFALVREWWVEPEFRRRGIGRELLRHVAAEFAAVGVRQLRVRTTAPDGGTRDMLTRCGFRAGPAEMVREIEVESPKPRRTKSKTKTP
jgi:GNAT superfamily N-acetyltransferase